MHYLAQAVGKRLPVKYLGKIGNIRLSLTVLSLLIFPTAVAGNGTVKNYETSEAF
jgi:hypothetical protein